MMGGFFHDFLYEVAFQQTAAGGQVFGGGPFSVLLRMITQDAITLDFEPRPADCGGSDPRTGWPNP